MSYRAPVYDAIFICEGLQGVDRSGRASGERYVYGVLLGTGKEGYDKLIEKLKELPDGATLAIYPPLRPLIGGRQLDPLPPYYDRRLWDIVTEKKLKVVYWSGRPEPK